MRRDDGCPEIFENLMPTEFQKMNCEATCVRATVNQDKTNYQYNNNKISSRHKKVTFENKRQKYNLESKIQS